MRMVLTACTHLSLVVMALAVVPTSAFYGSYLPVGSRTCFIAVKVPPLSQDVLRPKELVGTASVTCLAGSPSSRSEDIAKEAAIAGRSYADALAGPEEPALDGAAIMEAAIQAAKAEANKRAQQGSAPSRLGTVGFGTRRAGTQALAAGPKRLGTARVAGGTQAVRRATPTPTPTSPAATLSSTPSWFLSPSAAGRAITNAEVLAVLRSTNSFSSEELVSYLAMSGYSGTVREAMKAKVEAARTGGLDLTLPELDIEQAAKMLAQAEVSVKEARQLRSEAEVLEESVLALAPQILAATEQLKTLEPQVQPWEWIPDWFPCWHVATLRQEWAKASARLDALLQQRQDAESKYKEKSVSASSMEAKACSERQEAGLLRNSAFSDMRQFPGDEARVEAASHVITDAEKALLLNGFRAALDVLTAGREALERISLRPDRKASPASLPGRLHALLEAASVSSPASNASPDTAGAAGGGIFHFLRNIA